MAERVDRIFIGFQGAVAGASRKSGCFKAATQDTYKGTSENEKAVINDSLRLKLTEEFRNAFMTE